MIHNEHEHYLLNVRYLTQQRDMKDEETDWEVYHLLAAHHGMDEDSLMELLPITREEIRGSLVRLEKAMLIDVTPQGLRVLSVPEMVLRCQAKYDRGCRFSIEGGVIRLKSGEDEHR